MSDRSINLNQTEAFAQILPSAPQLSSHQTGWSDFFLAYYQQHPGCESPKSIFRQHALEIIDSGFESSHERYLEVQHLAYRLQGGETCFCPANTSHWTKKINERRLEVMNKCPKGLASRRNQTRISRGFSLIIDDSGHRKSGNFTAGVGRQYLGEIGKTDNGNVVVTTHLEEAFSQTTINLEKAITVWVASIEIEISRLKGHRKIAIVMNAPSFCDADDIDYFITNVEPFKVTEQWIVDTYSERNWVEVFYREAKGWLGLKEYQVREKKD